MTVIYLQRDVSRGQSDVTAVLVVVNTIIKGPRYSMPMQRNVIIRRPKRDNECVMGYCGKTYCQQGSPANQGEGMHQVAGTLGVGDHTPNDSLGRLARLLNWPIFCLQISSRWVKWFAVLPLY